MQELEQAIPDVATEERMEPRARTPDDLGIGGSVGHFKRYVVRRCIGEGGMGRVYQAFDPVLRREVAVKVMRPDVPEPERRRFRREAIFGARFCHPSIVRIFDMGEHRSDDGRRVEWFSMEHLPGSDLERVLGRAMSHGRRLPLLSVVDIFRQVLSALQYCHECYVVHRDVKPANIYVTRDPNTRFLTTKLLDFGIALDLDGPAQPEVLCGNPFYMAPEQTRHGAAIDARADVYAAGLSFYEALTGSHPLDDFRNAPLETVLSAQTKFTPKPPSALLPPTTSPRIAQAVDMIFERSTAKDPDDRFQSARDMREAMLVFLSPV
ncbi:MAG: serine/threonine-protein kinase [Nannocystaceae bacterium]